jgi:hydroxypyruvate isomerase
MLSGVVPEPAKGARRTSPEQLRESYISNLRFAAGELGRAGIKLHIEPINTRAKPGMYLRHSSQALALIDEAAVDNAWLQYDLFHMQIMEGDLAHTIKSLLPRIGHMQIADAPARHEPGTGEINFPFLFSHIDSLGYEGWVGAEYNPSGSTADSFAWFAPYAQRAQACASETLA